MLATGSPGCWPGTATWTGCAPGPRRRLGCRRGTGLPAGRPRRRGRAARPGRRRATGMPPRNWPTLADRGDVDGLRAQIDAGDGHAARRLPDLLIKQGRHEEAKRLRRFGLNPDGVNCPCVKVASSSRRLEQQSNPIRPTPCGVENERFSGTGPAGLPTLFLAGGERLEKVSRSRSARQRRDCPRFPSGCGVSGRRRSASPSPMRTTRWSPAGGPGPRAPDTRVSATGQNLDWQTRALTEAGLHADLRPASSRVRACLRNRPA